MTSVVSLYLSITLVIERRNVVVLPESPCYSTSALRQDAQPQLRGYLFLFEPSSNCLWKILPGVLFFARAGVHC